MHFILFVFYNYLLHKLMSDSPKKGMLTTLLASLEDKFNPANKNKENMLFDQISLIKDTLVKSKLKQSEHTKPSIWKTSVSRWNTGDGITPKKLTISSWNVNGIRAILQKGQLKDYLNNVKPDIFCFNQTKIDQKAYDANPIRFKGYQSYWNFCKRSAGYSGVAIFSKYRPISIVEDLPQAEHSDEGRLLLLEFEKFFLISVYVVNSGKRLQRLQYRTQQYDIAFRNYLQDLKKKKPVIVCGDLNVCHKDIDIKNPKRNQKSPGFTVKERNNFSELLSNGWIDTFRHLYPNEIKYTWWNLKTNSRSTNNGWRIDYFLVSKQLINQIKDSRIQNKIEGSDHCPIQIDIELQ